MAKPDKKLFLLDALALIYRAHFAFSKNPRITSTGLNTGAVYGFTNSLLEIIQKEKPTHIGVAFDTDVPTFRHVEFEAYKAQREKQPEDIKIAKPYIRQLIEAFNIPILEVDGFEADDVIGTLAKKACRAGFEVFMMTPDKDFGQLVEEHIYHYKPAYMGNAVDILGVKEVLEKWDVERIDQVIDMLGLQGDAVDNIPGIPGIGPKTASKLLKEYGTVENIVAHADEIKGKNGERIKEFGEQGILSKRLATINQEVPIDFDPDALLYTGPDDAKLKPLLQELEFRSTMRRLYGEEGTSAVAAATAAVAKKAPKQGASLQGDLFAPAADSQETEQDGTEVMTAVADLAAEDHRTLAGPRTIYNSTHHYHLMQTQRQQEELVKHLKQQKGFCFDTETDALDPVEARLVGISFSWYPGEAYYVPVPENEAEAKELIGRFKEVLEDEKVRKIGQNLKYDILALRKYGIEVQGPVTDTMIAHYLLEPDMRHGMDLLAETYLNYKPVSITELIGSKGKDQKTMRDVPLEAIKEYAAEDADITLQLERKLMPLLKQEKLLKLYEEVEAPLVHVLADIEYNGINVDTDALKELSVQLDQEAKELEKQIYQEAGEEFNIGSPKQLGEILFDKLKLIDKPKTTKTGQYATGEEILIKLADEHEIVKHILEYRQLTKLCSTYIDALPKLISPRDGRVHTSFNQAVTATGRLSSTNPNLQNIPIRTERGREIRKAFVPRSEGFTLLSADYSQVELRLMAGFAKDEAMVEAFREGKDIHAATAAKIYKIDIEAVDSDMRRKAKTANFGIIYGISAFGLAQRLNIPRKEASDLIEAYFQEFPGVKKYMDESIHKAREQEYVETIMGRRRYLRDINSRNQTVRGFAERNAINAPIQGSAADIIKVAMVNIHHWMKKQQLKSRMVLQVHDELVFDVHLDELELMKEHIPLFMSTAVDLPVPLEVGLGTGPNWLEAH
ncbi:DNA polymerase I [Cesiribacter sp. SM1]|uniref:DNA polymerase I n=1 Tax=Cesiribacter sp. SM1 TaxID=2861196 RepID=UPI001CD3932C|nr:DNA polymerase I [Cesiribacter sp. SM1]